MYNKYNQRYDVLGRFFISGKEYCRVKFLVTKHEQIVSAEAVKSGNFTDDSIIVKPVSQPIVKTDEATQKALEEAIRTGIEKLDEVTGLTFIEPVPPVQVTTEELNPVGLDLPYIIMATNPKGEDIAIQSDKLEAFCEENKLDFEAVQAVLEGKQKTHRKWRFVKRG